jgi:hypothetical protein
MPEEEKQCACGAQLSRIGEETCEKLDYIPAKMQVLRHIRPKYACKACEGVEDDGSTVKIAPAGTTDSQKHGYRGAAGPHCRLQICRCTAAVPPTKNLQAVGGRFVTGNAGQLDDPGGRALPAGHRVAAPGNPQRSMINIDESPLQVLKEPGEAIPANRSCGYFVAAPFLHRLFCINTIPREVGRWFRIFSKTTWAMFKVTAIADMIICPAIRTSPTWAVWRMPGESLWR